MLRCDQCGKRLRAPDRSVGRAVRCPCGARIAVPAPTAESTPGDLLAGLEGLADGAAVGRPCPACAADVAASAVICTACGYNFRTARQLATNLEAGAPPAAAEPSARVSKPSRRPDPADAPRFPIKLFVVVLLAIAAVGGVFALIKSVRAYDPKAQGDALLKKVAPGMTLAQVVAILGPPREAYRHSTGKGMDEAFPVGQPIKAEYSPNFLTAYSGRIDGGFFLLYRFSMAGDHKVFFDSTGTMEGIEEVKSLFRS